MPPPDRITFAGPVNNNRAFRLFHRPPSLPNPEHLTTMRNDLLDVFSCRFNPLRYEQPQRHFRDWVEHMLDCGVKVHVAEVQYGERPFECDLPHVDHLGLRASTAAWAKENALNLAFWRNNHQAKYICWCDADIFFEDKNWAAETVQALQLYNIVQPWYQALDRGPDGEIMQTHTSFCYHYTRGDPLIPQTKNGKPYGNHAHPGYCWASKRDVLESTGGLFELGGMGSSDRAMALSLVGKARHAAPKRANKAYLEELERFQARIMPAVKHRIGYVKNVINHQFHGSKPNRQYLSRWNMFLRHGFDPHTDLARNMDGIYEWAGNKPELEREWLTYLAQRNEDANCL